MLLQQVAVQQTCCTHLCVREVIMKGANGIPVQIGPKQHSGDQCPHHTGSTSIEQQCPVVVGDLPHLHFQQYAVDGCQSCWSSRAQLSALMSYCNTSSTGSCGSNDSCFKQDGACAKLCMMSRADQMQDDTGTNALSCSWLLCVRAMPGCNRTLTYAAARNLEHCISTLQAVGDKHVTVAEQAACSSQGISKIFQKATYRS